MWPLTTCYLLRVPLCDRLARPASPFSLIAAYLSRPCFEARVQPMLVTHRGRVIGAETCSHLLVCVSVSHAGANTLTGLRCSPPVCSRRGGPTSCFTAADGTWLRCFFRSFFSPHTHTHTKKTPHPLNEQVNTDEKCYGRRPS